MSPSAVAKMYQSTIAQVVAFSAIAAGLSQMASPARPELPDEEPETPVVQPVSTDPGSVNAEPSESAQNNVFAHTSTPSVSDMPGPRLPAGLVATTSPVAPRTSTAFLPASPPQKIARQQGQRSGSGSQTKSTFSVPQVAQVKPWFRDGPESSVNDPISPGTQQAFEDDIALVRTDDPYYDERFTKKELDEINRIRVLDREGKLDHVEKLDRVRDWIDDLEAGNRITPDVADIYDIRLDHAEYLYDEATADGNLDSKKPVSFWRRATSTVLDFVPFVGNAKAAYEAVVGIDPITGEELSALDRAVSAGGVVLPWLKGIKKGVKIVKGVAKYGDEGADVVGLIGKTTKSRGVLRGASNGKSVVLGEGMDTVKAATKELQSNGLNAKWYQAWGKNFPKNRPMTPTELKAALARNERWIRTKIKEGYDFHDIGIDPTRSVRSPFYELEKRILKEFDIKTIPVPRSN